jgi:type IV secretory pathway VirB10-like protein
MEPKRKIVIPLGDASREAVPASNYDGGVTVPAPLFDEEATMGARPVVPLAEASRETSRRFPLLALVVILAVGAGVAGGFAIGVYKSRQNRTAAATSTNTAATTASTDVPAQTQAEQLPVIASKQSSEPRARTTEAENAPTERTARDSKPAKDDEQLIPPVEVRERVREAREARREREDKIKDDGEQQREVKRQKKEQRRRAREADERDADVNQQIERAGREVNRIRDIFEGQRP